MKKEKKGKYLFSAYCNYIWDNDLNNKKLDQFHNTLISFYENTIILNACNEKQSFKIISYKEFNNISKKQNDLELYEIHNDY